MLGAVSLAVSFIELVIDIVRRHKVIVRQFYDFLAIEMSNELQSFLLIEWFLDAAPICHSLDNFHDFLLLLFLLSLYKVLQRQDEVHIVSCYFSLTACLTCACEYLPSLNHLPIFL